MDRFVYWPTDSLNGVVVWDRPTRKTVLVATSMVTDEFLFKPYELSYVL